ncbi:tyrosine-type recombinase/integrase [Streptosporangium subroseum]|uniref:tyrosine-type recombinase/integrase n=1 Tax=Streptosporangium subroseum TaxID=106412 RepID=UPI0034447ACD
MSQPRSLRPHRRACQAASQFRDCAQRGVPGPRIRCIALVPYYAGTRISEVVRLDVDDVLLSARKGKLRLYGKGDKFREVDIHPKLRTDLQLWLDERPNWPHADDNRALFLNAHAHPARPIPARIRPISGTLRQIRRRRRRRRRPRGQARPRSSPPVTSGHTARRVDTGAQPSDLTRVVLTAEALDRQTGEQRRALETVVALHGVLLILIEAQSTKDLVAVS